MLISFEEARLPLLGRCGEVGTGRADSIKGSGDLGFVDLGSYVPPWLYGTTLDMSESLDCPLR